MENKPNREDGANKIKVDNIDANKTNETMVIDDNVDSNEVNEESSIDEINHSDYTQDTAPIPVVENYLNPSSNNISQEYKNKNKAKTFPKLFSYIAVGVICSLLGGVGTGAVLLYASPRFSNSITSIGNTDRSKTTNEPSSAYLVSTNTTNMSVAEIAKKVGPAAVGISTSSGASSQYSQGSTDDGMGSGIIINKDGYILTNYHVISGAQSVKVILSSGKEVSAKVVNYDSASDVAIIKVTSNIEMPGIAELGDSDALQVGEPAIAIGNPLGKELLGSVTVGVISALNREIQVSDKKQAYIQTDAAINPGNSGGALVNSKGQVIGINTAKIGGSGVEGLGFALPINAIKSKIVALSKPIIMLGISGNNVTAAFAKQSNIPIGFLIKAVKDSTPASKAGIKVNDVIVKFDGQKVTSVDDINTAKAKHKVGDVVKVEVFRDNQTKIINVTLSE